METVELMEFLERGEDSTRQFKKDVTNTDSLAAEIVAFSNGAGGKLFIGVNDDGSIVGLSPEDIRRLNQLISNTASQNVQPPINTVTENIKTPDGIVMIVEIPAGINKPYQDKNGVFWVKSGADKRKASSREEIQRLFQKSNLIHADELPVSGTGIDDLDIDYFKNFFKKRFDKELADEVISLPEILENMNLMKDGFLTTSGALLFAKSPQYKLPAFIVKAVFLNANDISTSVYEDSRDIAGNLSSVFNDTVNFIISNIHHVQGEQGFNSVGIPEIPPEAIQELVANALIHRDYFVSAAVRVFIFKNRVEIISPGHLPNNLAIENIKRGNSVTRNPILASYAYHLLPYRGIGSGIPRALSKYPDIDFIDDRDGNLFKVIIKREYSSG